MKKLFICLAIILSFFSLKGQNNGTSEINGTLDVKVSITTGEHNGSAEWDSVYNAWIDGKINVVIQNMSELKNYEKDELTKIVKLLGYYTKNDGGEGFLFWDSTQSKNTHNGGTVIDPTHSSLVGDSAWYFPENIGNGCWVRVENNSHINMMWFGVTSSNSEQAFYSAFQTVQNNGIIDAREVSSNCYFINDFTLNMDKPFTWFTGSNVYTLVEGLTLHSGVTVIGNNTIFELEDSLSSYTNRNPIFETGQHVDSCSVSGNIITPDSIELYEVGSLVGIDGADNKSYNNYSILNSNIDSLTTIINVNTTAEFNNSGTLIINDELIFYSSKTGTSFNNCIRGYGGTLPTEHLSGDTIFHTSYFISEIDSISSNSVFLKDSVYRNVNNVQCIIGSNNIIIEGSIILNGNYNINKGNLPGSSYGFLSILSNNVFLGEKVKIINWEQGGAFLEASRNNNISGSYSNIGIPSSSLGSAIWIFRQSNKNTIHPISISNSYKGVFVDDRTSSTNKYDGSSNYNDIRIPSITSCDSPFEISGSSFNSVYCNNIDNSSFIAPTTPIIIQNGSQGTEPRNSTNNNIYVENITSGSTAAGVIRGNQNRIFTLNANTPFDVIGSDNIGISLDSLFLSYKSVINNSFNYAIDDFVVHKSGNESISGTKTFETNPEIKNSDPILTLIDIDGNTTTSITRVDFRRSDNNRNGYIGYNSSSNSNYDVNNEVGLLRFLSQGAVIATFDNNSMNLIAKSEKPNENTVLVVDNTNEVGYRELNIYSQSQVDSVASYIAQAKLDSATGWATYTDTEYTLISPFTILGGDTATLPNNADSINDAQKPLGLVSFYNPVDSLILAQNDGDSYEIRVSFAAESSNADTYFEIMMEIDDSNIYPFVDNRRFRKGANEQQNFSFSIPYYSGQAFVTGGAKLKIAPSHNMEINNISYFIHRTHKAK